MQNRNPTNLKLEATPSDTEQHIPNPTPEVIKYQEQAARKYQMYLLMEKRQEMQQLESEKEKELQTLEMQKKQQLDEFEDFKNNIDKFSKGLEDFRNKYYQLFGSQQDLTKNEEFLEAMKIIKANTKTLYNAFQISDKNDLEILTRCSIYLTELIDKRYLLSKHCFDHFVKPLVNDFSDFNKHLAKNYKDCFQQNQDFLKNYKHRYKNEIYEKYIDYIPKCVLTNDNWNKPEKSRNYMIENNLCVRSININKSKDKDLWSIELKALTTNADVNREAYFLSKELNKKLADALTTIGFSSKYPGVEYFPSGNSLNTRIFKINGTLQQMRNVWPHVLLAISNLEGIKVFDKVPNIQTVLQTVPDLDNAQQGSHPFWTHPIPLNTRMGTLKHEQSDNNYMQPK